MSDSSIDTVSESKHYKRLIGFLRLAGGTVGILSIVLGIIGLVVLGGLNPRTVINDVYQIIFGLLILLIELRLKQLLVHFRFLTHFGGVGIFYVFLGGLSLGAAWYQYVVGIVEIALGIVYCILACLNRQMYSSKLPSQKLSNNTNSQAVETTTTKNKNKLPDSAFDDIEANNNTSTTKSYNNNQPSAPPAVPSSSTPGGPDIGIGNAASENPFEEFDTGAKRTRGGYAI